jgi:hypothetical protein
MFNLKKIIHANFVSIASSDSDGSAGNKMQENVFFSAFMDSSKIYCFFLLFNYAL